MKNNILPLLLLCNGCATDTALQSIPQSVRERIGAVNRVIFQRLYAADGSLNEFTQANAALEATYVSAGSLANDSKITFSPIIEGAISDPVAPVEVGGGADSLYGIPELAALNPQKFAAKMHNIQQRTSIKPIKKYMGCETLGVLLVNECGQIWGDFANNGTDDVIRPIEIKTLFVSDKGIGGREGRDSNDITWYFPPNWSDDIGYVTPSDFDPLSDSVLIAIENNS